MLTNKKIGVLIIMFSLFFVSCSVKNIEYKQNNDVVKNVNKHNSNNPATSISGEKNKAIGGEALEEGSKDVSIYNGIDNEAPKKPNLLNNK